MAQFRARFLARARTEREQLAAAMAAGDTAEIRRIAHSLSGAGGVFGFPQVSAAAQQVEEAVDVEGSAAGLDTLCRSLLTELDGALQEG